MNLIAFMRQSHPNDCDFVVVAYIFFMLVNEKEAKNGRVVLKKKRFMVLCKVIFILLNTLLC